MPKVYSLLIAILGMLSTSTMARADTSKKDKCMAALPKPSGAPADTPVPKRPNRVVLFDASPSKENIANANRIFVLDACNDSAVVQDLWLKLQAQFDKTGKPDTVEAGKLKSFLLGNAGRLAKFSSIRWISRKGDQADVYVLHLTTSARTIDFNEVPRKTRFDTDIGTLAQLAAAIVGAAPGARAQVANAPGYITTARTWILGKDLATLKIAVAEKGKPSEPSTPPSSKPSTPPNSKPPGPPGQRPHPVPSSDSRSGGMIALRVASDSFGGQSEEPATDADTGPATLAVDVITGPKEHFFLSANAGATDVQQIKYDAATRSLAPAKKPTTFYVSTNYALGDLYDDGSDINWANRFIHGIYFGVFVEASQRPFEQVGAIVGFRRNFAPFLDNLLPLQTVSPFLGWVWVRNDDVTGSAASPTVTSRYAKRKFMWGLSLNLDKALGWVGS